MIIQSSAVSLNSSRRYNCNQFQYAEHTEWDNATGEFSQETCSETIQVREESLSRNGAAYVPIFQDEESADTPQKPTIYTEMEALKNRLSPLQTKGIPTVQERLEMIRDIQQKSLDYLLRVLFGDDEKYCKGINKIDRTTTPSEKSANNPVTKSANELGRNLGTGWSHYTFYYYEETETTCFDTQGTAITADGRQLNFNISVEMSRSFVEMAEEKN